MSMLKSAANWYVSLSERKRTVIHWLMAAGAIAYVAIRAEPGALHGMLLLAGLFLGPVLLVYGGLIALAAVVGVVRVAWDEAGKKP